MPKKITQPLDPLEKLLWLVRGVCAEERGRRQQLADYLDVPLPRVSRWLSAKDAPEPSGEVALGMLYWLQDTDREAWKLYFLRSPKS